MNPPGRALPHRLLAALGRLLGWAVDLAYPTDCILCGRPIRFPAQSPRHVGYLCADCLRALPLHRHAHCKICSLETPEPDPREDFICLRCTALRPAYTRAFVAARYEDPLRTLIQAFKYRRGLWLTHDLVRLLLAAWQTQILPLGLTFDAIVPVPQTPWKRLTRRYNQAQILAKHLARALSLPCREDLLQRVETDVRSQTRLHREARLLNAEAAYRLRRTHRPVQGHTLLLIDDVMTTGATLDACARRLKEAGAAAVYALALARPLPL